MYPRSADLSSPDANDSPALSLASLYYVSLLVAPQVVILQRTVRINMATSLTHTHPMLYKMERNPDWNVFRNMATAHQRPSAALQQEQSDQATSQSLFISAAPDA